MTPDDLEKRLRDHREVMDLLTSVAEAAEEMAELARRIAVLAQQADWVDVIARADVVHLGDGRKLKRGDEVRVQRVLADVLAADGRVVIRERPPLV
jgi:ABC-type hemin transport system ATPase subunit